MRVLLTRAVADAMRTRDTLIAAGHQVLVSPVIGVIALEASWPDGIVDTVLASSANAFDAPTPDFGPVPEARRLMPLFLVGERTAERARAHGFAGATIVAANAAALSLAFGTMARKPRNLVYLAGRDRKPDIEAALSAAGQSVEVIEVYEARDADALDDEAVAAIRALEVDAVLHYSRRSASVFATLASGSGLDISGPRHLCLSGDVAASLRERGLPHVVIAGAPNEAALLELVAR